MCRFGGPVPVAGGRPRATAAALPAAANGRAGLCDENDDAGVATKAPSSGEDSRDDDEERSRKDAVEESRSLEGTLD